MPLVSAHMLETSLNEAERFLQETTEALEKLEQSVSNDKLTEWRRDEAKCYARGVWSSMHTVRTPTCDSTERQPIVESRLVAPASGMSAAESISA